jgi:Ca-activated chloride channel homolog
MSAIRSGFLLLLLFMLPEEETNAQISAKTQQDFGHQTELINQSTLSVQTMVKGFFEVYQTFKSAKGKPGNVAPRFTCPVQMSDYYYTQAQQKSGNVGAQLKPLSTQLYQALEKIDAQCKAIEVYCRLKDYEKDGFQAGLALIEQLQPLVADFAKAKGQYESGLVALRQKMGGTPQPSYAQLEKNLRQILEKDKMLIERMTYNFNPETPTAWPKDEILKSISEMALFLEQIKLNAPSIGYPASHDYSACVSCAHDMQAHKKYVLDNYTLEARKSDQHANQAYWGLINYYDGCLVSFFNQFAGSSGQGGLYPLPATRIAPSFDLKKAPTEVVLNAKAFHDLPYQSLEIRPQNGAIPVATNQALNKYVELINEEVRLANNLLRSLHNQDIDLTDFSGKKSFHFYQSEFELPQSLFQETILANRHLPESAQKSIGAQAQVLFNILQEMDERREQCLLFAQNATHKKEGFRKMEEIRDRYLILYEKLDLYKERLYGDLKKIFDSYQFTDEKNAWVKSYRALAEVVADDRELLFSAKGYFKKPGASLGFNPEKLTASTRKLIAEEFTNLKGIPKIGRNNGLCPYSPYEDVGTLSQRFVTYSDNIAKKKYEDFIYAYNQIVHEHNRFVELAKVPLLKQVSQPNWFGLREPYREKPTPVSSGSDQPPAQTMPQVQPKEKLPEKQLPEVEPKKMDTVRIEVIKKEIVRDTVYVRDTIYREKPPLIDDNFYDLAGYQPNNLVLLLDVSSSMDAPDRLPLLQKSVKKLVTLLRPEDNLALVVYSGSARVLLPPTSGRDKDKIIRAIDALEPGGNTDANMGLAMAYRVANQQFKNNGNNRIVLATDGEFGLRPALFDMVDKNAVKGIVLTIFKFGEKPTPGLKKISDRGKGNLVSINEKNAEIFMVQEAKNAKK